MRRRAGGDLRTDLGRAGAEQYLVATFYIQTFACRELVDFRVARDEKMKREEQHELASLIGAIP